MSSRAAVMTSPCLRRASVPGINLAYQRGIGDSRYRAVQSYAPLMQQDDARRDLADEVEIVLDDQDAKPFACHQAGEDSGEPLALGTRQSRRRLRPQEHLP